MLKKVIGLFLYFIVVIFSSIDAAAFYEINTPQKYEGVLMHGTTVAGLFAPSTLSTRKKRGSQTEQPQPVAPSSQGSQQPEVVQPAAPSVPAPAPAAPAGASAPQPVVAPPSAPPVAGAPQTPTAQPVAPAPQPFISPPARPQVVRKGEVSFNFDDADVYSVIQTILGDVLKVNYIVDPNVKGRVTFRSVEPISKENVLPLMEVILRLNGVGIVEEGGLYRIVPIADISKEPAPVGLGRDPEKVKITGKALVQVVQVRYIQSSDMVRVLTPFLSKNAVIVDVPKSNYVVIVDTDANVKRLLELVKIFDSEELKEVTPKVFVYAVQNSKAKDVASLLQQIFQGQKPAVSKIAAPVRTTLPGQQPQPAPSQPQVSMGGQQAGEALVSEVTKIIPDEVTNSIVVLATPEDYALIFDTIKKIDIPPRQVMIEGLIVDITLNDNLSYGLSWSLNTDVRFSGIKPFTNGVDLSGNAYNNAAGLSPTPSDKGFTFIGTDPSGNIRAVLTALEDRSRAKVVAAPHILVSDNREARIQIGQQVPLATSQTAQITGTTAGTTNTPVYGTTTVQYKDIGIILKVKPQVNDSGLISLELSQEISAISSQTITVGGLGEVAIDKTEATSNLVARDGETIIIGGLIREDNSHGATGLPFLSRIPILGALFGSKSDTVTRKETIILLTPHVIRNQQEAGEVTSDYIKRYKGATGDKDIDNLIRERTGKEQAPAKDQPVTPQTAPGK
ncbi:MAG: hypothetical protein M0Z71_09080 [Nitrospiraceae bacterium]|nr:hypothetical protein [Nitrospiraceae bacterium]